MNRQIQVVDFTMADKLLDQFEPERGNNHLIYGYIRLFAIGIFIIMMLMTVFDKSSILERLDSYFEAFGVTTGVILSVVIVLFLYTSHFIYQINQAIKELKNHPMVEGKRVFRFYSIFTLVIWQFLMGSRLFYLGERSPLQWLSSFLLALFVLSGMIILIRDIKLFFKRKR